MTLATFDRLKPLLYRTKRVHLQGWGEPFQNPHFFAMAQMASEAGCKVSTTTGGLGMTVDRAERLVGGGLDIVAFSLAGTDSVSNNARQGMDFDQVCRSIHTLRQERLRQKAETPEIHIAYLLLASKVQAIIGLPALMEDLGVRRAVISTLDYLPEPGLEKEAFALEDGEKIEEITTLLQTTAAAAEHLGLELYYDFPRPSGSGYGCSENIGSSLFVAADGAVSPCVFVGVPTGMSDVGRRIFGNVCLHSPLEIWEDADYRLFRRRLAEGDGDPVCQSCPKRFTPAK